MSDALTEETLLVRLRRDRAESDKFVAGQRKLIEEALKLERDRKLAPLLASAAFIGGMAGALVTAFGVITRLSGH